MQPKLLLILTKSIHHIANRGLFFLSEACRKGAGCTQLTGLSGPWYHSCPFFNNAAFQVIPSQWIPALDCCPSTVLACIFQTRSHLYFPTMCLISLDSLFLVLPWLGFNSSHYHCLLMSQAYYSPSRKVNQSRH